MKLFSESLHNQLNLNPADYLILQEIEEKKKDSKSISDYIESFSAPVIIKLANHSDKFLHHCKNSGLDFIWRQRWIAYGTLLMPEGTSFANYETTNEFDRFRGIYFFYQAYQIAKRQQGRFSDNEIPFLKNAIKYNSIHAILRYSHHRYQLFDSKSLSVSEYQDDLLTTIRCCRKLTDNYGSFAYLMLAEAYFRMCKISIEEKNIPGIEKNCSAAVACCDYANQVLDESRDAILNASLGQGLVCSNTLGFISPEIAKEYIKGTTSKYLGLSKLLLVSSSPSPS